MDVGETLVLWDFSSESQQHEALCLRLIKKKTHHPPMALESGKYGETGENYQV